MTPDKLLDICGRAGGLFYPNDSPLFQFPTNFVDTDLSLLRLNAESVFRMSDRGRYRRGYYSPSPYDYDYDYDYVYEKRPRHRSLGRQALDKLEDAIGTLSLDSHHHDRVDNSRALTHYHGDGHHHHDHHHHHRHHSRGRHHPHDRDYYEYDEPRRARSRSRHRHRAYHSASPTRRHHHHSRSRSRWGRGLQAAVDAAAIEAFRLRKEPGKWKGPKGERIATAAISAGVIGAATGKGTDEGKQKGALGSALGGLVVNRLVNGPRREVR